MRIRHYFTQSSYDLTQQQLEQPKSMVMVETNQPRISATTTVEEFRSMTLPNRSNKKNPALVTMDPKSVEHPVTMIPPPPPPRVIAPRMVPSKRCHSVPSLLLPPTTGPPKEFGDPIVTAKTGTRWDLCIRIRDQNLIEYLFQGLDRAFPFHPSPFSFLFFPLFHPPEEDPQSVRQAEREQEQHQHQQEQLQEDEEKRDGGRLYGKEKRFEFPAQTTRIAYVYFFLQCSFHSLPRIHLKERNKSREIQRQRHPPLCSLESFVDDEDQRQQLIQRSRSESEIRRSDPLVPVPSDPPYDVPRSLICPLLIPSTLSVQEKISSPEVINGWIVQPPKAEVYVNLMEDEDEGERPREDNRRKEDEDREVEAKISSRINSEEKKRLA